MGKYGTTDLGADLHPCEICCKVSVLCFSKCRECADLLLEGESPADIRHGIYQSRVRAYRDYDKLLTKFDNCRACLARVVEKFREY